MQIKFWFWACFETKLYWNCIESGCRIKSEMFTFVVCFRTHFNGQSNSISLNLEPGSILSFSNAWFWFETISFHIQICWSNEGFEFEATQNIEHVNFLIRVRKRWFSHETCIRHYKSNVDFEHVHFHMFDSKTYALTRM